MARNNLDIRAPVSKSVTCLLKEFRSIYEEKLRRTECEITSPEERVRMKVRILRSYVDDLSDQNQVLVQTVEELEKEANEKVTSLERKLRVSDESVHDLSHQRRCLEEDNRRLGANLEELKAETFTLQQVIQRAQHTHDLDVFGVTSRTAALERITDHSAYSAQSPQKPGDLMKAQVEDLRNQLKAKNGIIQSLREEIKTLLFHSAQKKNETLGKMEAVLLLQKPVLEKTQITSRDVIGEPHTRLWVAHQEAAASDGEGKKVVEVLAEVGNSKEEIEERVHTFSEKEQARVVGRVVNSLKQSEMEVSKLTSWVEQLQLQQGKARSSSTHSTSLDPHKQKLCGLDNSGRREVNRAVLQDSSAGLQWNLSQQQEHLLRSHKQLCLKQEQVKRRREKAKAAARELPDQEKLIHRLQLDIVSPQTTQKRLAMKEQHMDQLAEEHSHTLQSLHNQLQTSEEKVNSLGLEVGLLKSKLQEKTEQSQQLRDQILEQREALSRASATLKDTRRAAGNKIQRRENKLSMAQKQLQKAKKQLSDCEEECLQKQKELEKLQEENAELKVQVKEHSQELLRLSSDKRKVELELAVITEKHRTTQQEVAGRDQVILQLKTELRVSEEKHQGAQNERVLQEAEVSRLNERVRRQQSQLQELSKMCHQGDAHLDQKEQDRQQLQSQLQLAQQQLKRQCERLERLEGELTTSRQGHAADTERWSHRNLLLQKQLQLVQEQNAQYAQILPELQENLSQSQHALQLSQEKVTEYEELLKKSDGERRLVKQQLEEVRGELRESRTATQSHQSKADIFKQKYMAAMDKVQQLQAQNQRLKEDMQLSKKQAAEAEAEVSSLRDEMCSLECRYKKKVSQMEHWEEAVEQLTEELQAALDSLRTREDRGLWCEEEMERFRVKVGSQHKQISEYEEKFLQLQTDFTSYLDAHSCSNAEYEAVRKQLELSQKALQQKEEEVVQVKAELQHTLLTLHSGSEEVQELHEEVEKTLEQKKPEEEENQAVRNHPKLLGQQLQKLLALYRDTADSVAGQEESAVLLLSSLRTTEEQLNESLQRGEKQNSYQLVQLQDILQKLQIEASDSQKSLRKALEDTVEQQRRSCEAVAERDEATEKMRQQEALVCRPRQEMQQEHGCYEEQQHRLSKLKLHMADKETGQDSLRFRNSNNAELLLQPGMTLEEAVTDNTHLQQERMQLVTIISQWIKEHKAASESLARRIKEQNGLLAAISKEKEHLQETRDSSVEELRRLRVQVEKREREIQQLKAIHSHSANQQALVNQLRGRLEVEENACKNVLANSLNRIEKMQSRFRESNVEPIKLLNQQLSNESEENERNKKLLENE